MIAPVVANPDEALLDRERTLHDEFALTRVWESAARACSHTWVCAQTCNNPNTPPRAIPLVSGPVIRLPGQYGKVRCDGYRTTPPADRQGAW